MKKVMVISLLTVFIMSFAVVASAEYDSILISGEHLYQDGKKVSIGEAAENSIIHTITSTKPVVIICENADFLTLHLLTDMLKSSSISYVVVER